MKRFLIITLCLISLTVAAQANQGTPTTYIRNTGGFKVDSVLVIPTNKTDVSQNGIGLKGRARVNATTNRLQYHNGTAWVNVGENMVSVTGTAADGITATTTNGAVVIGASQASATQRGTVRLYTTTGTNTNGAMDQNSTTTQLNAKGGLATSNTWSGTNRYTADITLASNASLRKYISSDETTNTQYLDIYNEGANVVAIRANNAGTAPSLTMGFRSNLFVWGPPTGSHTNLSSLLLSTSAQRFLFTGGTTTIGSQVYDPVVLAASYTNTGTTGYAYGMRIAPYFNSTSTQTDLPLTVGTSNAPGGNIANYNELFKIDKVGKITATNTINAPPASLNTEHTTFSQLRQYAASSTATSVNYTTGTAKVVKASGTITITLATTGVDDGFEYFIKNMGTGTVTVVVQGGGTIDGATSKSFNVTGTGGKFTKDGSNYLITGNF